MVQSFVSPLKIVSGVGAIKEVPSLLHSFKAKNILIFADPGIVDAGISKVLESQLKDTGVEYTVYSELVPEPPVSVGNKAVDTVRNGNYDLVIGIGGGSSLDIAKVAAVLHSNEGKIENYLNLSGDLELKNKGLPSILIPTTSGTGAEITDIAVFSLDETKDAISHEYLLADVAVIDPELTYSLPPKLTASTGVDALTHAVEALISVKATPLTDALALEAIRRLSQNIRTAVWDGKNVYARNEMAWGSMIAGLSFYNAGVSGVHALAYPLGGMFKVSHGESNAVLLPYIFDFIWPSCMEKMDMMAHALGVKKEGMTKREASLAAVIELKSIVEDVGIPSTLKDFGVEEKDLDKLAESGIRQKRLLSRSPMPYSLQDIRNRYEAALKGELKIDYEKQ